ncbi:MAG: hypothetical protein A2234_05650 [Elusimicrobia bacterium RIFOXYA2_FULL_58_8]|nr:MAG: hypothetical protein A2285_02985 [Elusimicrobia bacterium RIFOXYA12_FULL_57_11]OGS13792.1 MAG: hypothetical protein A2234_05650 [Elusimicrobia bacterium RIFOXYA2_FULL_58_8]
MGAGAVELDVQLSRDGELVLTHNINVDAISTSRGCVADFTREELQGLVLLDGDKRPSTERMAAFADVLPMLRRQADTHAGDAGAGIVAVVHIKIFDGFHGDWPGGNLLHRPCPKTDYKAIARKTYEAVESAGLTGRIMFVSFDYRVLDVIRSARSDARVGLLSIRRTPAITAAASRRYDAVALYHDRVQRRDLERARAHGLRVYVWSPTKKQSIEKFATEKGKVGKVDGIITNSIPDAIECVSARQGAGKNR